jgi:Lipopolysaccharide kinase (Kdo/WaaP) family
LNKLLHPLYGFPLAAVELLSAIGQSFRLLSLDSRPDSEHLVPEDFLGVNLAPGDDPASDDYIIERLGQLGIRQVRMDFTYDSAGGPAQRLLENLLDEGFDVVLDLLPPLAEAGLLYNDSDAQQRWGDFLAGVFERYQGRVSWFEIGNTPNRGKWSGFSSTTFIMASYIASERAKGFEVQLAGPNVSDFEPLYNATYLGLLRRLGATPDIHTDNLFVERVVEPEAYDHRVLGRLARNWLKLNLVKKARVLEALGKSAGCEQLVCTYTCWTIKRLQRRSAWPEQKRVDYLVRYLALAASSSALKRVYWGPLICSRDGLIDDGADDYPVVDQVSFYQRIRGSAASFAPTPAFHALAFTVASLAGSRCLQASHQPDGLSLFCYETRTGQHVLLAWCRDGQSRPMAQVLDADTRAGAKFHSATGEALPEPAVVSEHPLFIELPGPYRKPVCKLLHGSKTHNIVHLSNHELQSCPYTDERWVGAQMLRTDQQLQDLPLAETLLPEKIAQLEETRVLRDMRNRLWNVNDPRGRCEQVTVKLNRVKGIKRFTYRFRPSKGRRHWDNACQMLRRGVSTPLPVAFYEAPEQAGIRDSWYLCEFVPDAFSARDVYAAFRDGADQYRGLDKDAWFDLLAGFVCNMHNQQVIHRDLSAGNLLLHALPDGAIRPQAIDIGRAWIWSGPGSRVRNRQRMLDLIRIAYKLDWSDRYRFIEHYEKHLGQSLSPLWRIPFIYYDNKQSLKKAIKRKKRRRS